MAGTYNEKVAEGGDEQRYSGEDQLPGVMLGLQNPVLIRSAWPASPQEKELKIEERSAHSQV